MYTCSVFTQSEKTFFSINVKNVVKTICYSPLFVHLIIGKSKCAEAACVKYGISFSMHPGGRVFEGKEGNPHCGREASGMQRRGGKPSRHNFVSTSCILCFYV